MHYISMSIPTVTEILETDEEGSSSGSAEGNIFTDTFSQIIEPNDTEIGQLFAYRHSNSSARLFSSTICSRVPLEIVII